MEVGKAMRKIRLAFVTAVLGIVAVLGVPTYDERHVETSEEFMARICAGIYLTSDAETIDAGLEE